MERIMIVEDMPDNLLVLQATLEHEGYKVIPMLDGESALDHLQEGPDEIDLILSDVMMPGLSGYGLCRSVRHDPALAHLPIVLISAKRLDEQDVLLGINAGADDYLIRPIDPQLLNKKLRLLLDRKRDLEHWQHKYQDQAKEIESREWGARMLVHDIRNPLGGAIGAINMLATDPNTTEDQRFLIKLAQNCLQTQMNMLQDLLATVAAKNRSLTLNKQTFDLGVCVQEQIAFQQGVVAGVYDFQCQGLEDGLLVSADRQLIGRVVANLIVNAIKYGRQRSAITIWLGPPERCPLPITGHGRLVFMITNQGAAIPPDIQPQIFLPFTMGNNGKQNQVNSICTAGVGLGLCFCERVIDLHDGFINIISPLPEQDDGVAFYFILPNCSGE
jgi:DNA-binding response OmpR family regulator